MLYTIAIVLSFLGLLVVIMIHEFGHYLVARAFGFRDETRRVIELFERGQIRRVDVGTANGNDIFLSHRSYGLLAEVQEAVEEGRAQPRSRTMRLLAYLMMGERFLVRAPLTAIRVEVEGTVLAEDAAVVTVANVETYRGFLSLTPTASPIDGFLDIFESNSYASGTGSTGTSLDRLYVNGIGRQLTGSPLCTIGAINPPSL